MSDATPAKAASVQGVRDTLIDCMTSFGIHGDRAGEAADFILSAASGLRVEANVEPVGLCRRCGFRNVWRYGLCFLCTDPHAKTEREQT